MEEAGKGKPWFTYLSFQSVHDPLQVPHSYLQNVCRYKDNSRYFYSAMISALDHAVDLVVQSLKANNFYDNTIIVFTTDNGGAINMGGNNWPLRGTKGTLFEGGTRAIGFVHSPLLQKTGYTSQHLMHAVDWLPTLMSAIGQGGADTAKDGVDQWQALAGGNANQVRQEVVYNVKEKPFMAAMRIGDYKLIWGSRTTKDSWFKAKEEPMNKFVCNELQRSRSQANRSRILLPRGVETMDTLKLNVDEDVEYEEDYDMIEKLQADIDIKTRGETFLENTANVFSLLGDRLGKEHKFGDAVEGRAGGKKKKKKGNKNKKNRKNIIIPNKFGVRIKTFGEFQLYNLKTDPEERHDLSKTETGILENIKSRMLEHFYNLYPRHTPDDTMDGVPDKWGGYYGPGWCDAMNILDNPTSEF